MSKIKKILISLICGITVVCCMFALAACGDKDPDDKDNTQTGGNGGGGNQGGSAQTYALEAENIDLSYVVGGDSSATPSGASLITTYATASNGKIIRCLYKNRLFIEFEFEASAADENAKLSLVCMASYKDFTLDNDEFQIYVNPELSEDYYPVNESARVMYDEMSVSSSEMKEFTITTSMNIKNGTNTVYMLVNNTESLLPTASTMDAKAPDIDCIKISSTATITHTTYQNI